MPHALQGVTLPFTAWEQAVFVAIFAVVFIALIAGLLNWFSKREKEWQEFISKQNLQWQNWLQTSEERSNQQLSSVVETLKQVVDKLDSHDAKTDVAIATMEERSKARTRSKPG